MFTNVCFVQSMHWANIYQYVMFQSMNWANIYQCIMFQPMHWANIYQCVMFQSMHWATPKKETMLEGAGGDMPTTTDENLVKMGGRHEPGSLSFLRTGTPYVHIVGEVITL